MLVDDGHGAEDPLHLVVEIKGYRREDAKEKKSTMDTYWVPGVNHLGSYGRWAFSEFTEIYQIESDFEAKVESEFDKMIASAAAQPARCKVVMAKQPRKKPLRSPSKPSSTTRRSARISRQRSTSRCCRRSSRPR